MIPINDEQYLTVAHTMRMVGGRKVYEHRFLRFNRGLQETGRSDPWTFSESPGIEYCAGMVEDRGEFVLSCAEGDASAFFAVIPRGEVLRLLEPGKRNAFQISETVTAAVASEIPRNERSSETTIGASIASVAHGSGPPILYSTTMGGVNPIFVLPNLGSAKENDWRQHIFQREGGTPEAPLILWAESLVPKGATLWDIGAYAGTWSIVWGLLGHPVWAFEANPTLARYCNAGMILSGLPATCRSVAISHANGASVLYNPTVDGGGASIVRTFAESQLLPVQTQSLDSLWIASAMNPPNFLKIDVEGAELDVLRGGIHTVQKHHPKILFECWDEERGQRREELFRFLRDDLRYTVSRTTWPEMWIADPMP